AEAQISAKPEAPTDAAATAKEAQTEAAGKATETATPAEGKQESTVSTESASAGESGATEAPKSEVSAESVAKTGEPEEAKEQATTAAAEGEKTEEASKPAADAATTSASSGEKEATAAEGASVSADATTKKPEAPASELNIDAVPAVAISDKEQVTDKEGLTTTTGTTLIGHEFVPNGTVPSVEECAKRCYTEGCAGAKFDPATHECSLAYEDHQYCDGNEEEHRSVEATETLWIHCISCRQELKESTLGLFVEDTTVPTGASEKASNDEGSKTGRAPERSGDENTPAPKAIDTEEKFLSTINQDATLESTKETGSAITLRANGKASGSELKTADGVAADFLSSTPESPGAAGSIADKTEPVAVTLETKLDSVADESTRLPASVSEIKGDESVAPGDMQLDTTPIVVVLEAHGSVTSAPEAAKSDEQTTKIPSDTELVTNRIIEGEKAVADINMVTKDGGEAGIVEKVAETLSADELATTVRPELLISLTANTPLHVPIDSSEIASVAVPDSRTSTVAPGEVVQLSTAESPVKKTEVGDQKQESDLSGADTGFQHESQSTNAVAPEIIGKVTVHPESAESGNKLGASDIAAAVASAVASGFTTATTGLPHEESKTSNVVEAITVESHLITSATEPESHTEITSSDNPEEATVVQSHAEVTSASIPEASMEKESQVGVSSSGVLEASTEAQSHTEVTSSILPGTGIVVESHTAITSSNIPVGATVESGAEVTPSSSPQAITVEETHAEVTSGEEAVIAGASETGVTSSKVAETSKTETHEITGNVVEASTAESRESIEGATKIPEADGVGGTLFAENAVTDGSVVAQAHVDDNVKKVIQAASESGVAVTDTSPVIGDASVAAVTSGAVHEAAVTSDTSGETATTEPPVQAVSDLVNILSHNSKIEDVIRRTSQSPYEKGKEKESFVVDDASVIKDSDARRPTSVAHIREALTGTPSRSGVKMTSFQGTATGCPGRIEFEVSSIGELPPLNISSEATAETPADCARKCYEDADCVLAGFVPSPNGQSTCLLTSDIGICSPEDKPVPQHTANAPFIISCLKCSSKFKCNYTLSEVVELTRLHEVDAIEPVLSISQCAEACSRRNCAVAHYDHKSNLCSLSSEKKFGECSEEKPLAVDGDEPVLLECVRCFA
ncbi:unnamed protein product, partial [Gongylonema pulchrum]|uniref:Apple domain-containing protein n=1 Tax=Gongylonema pulchrum TaxID=637853 RepID=A0A183CUC2_9BILA